MASSMAAQSPGPPSQDKPGFTRQLSKSLKRKTSTTKVADQDKPADTAPVSNSNGVADKAAAQPSKPASGAAPITGGGAGDVPPASAGPSSTGQVPDTSTSQPPPSPKSASAPTTSSTLPAPNATADADKKESSVATSVTASPPSSSRRKEKSASEGTKSSTTVTEKPKATRPPPRKGKAPQDPSKPSFMSKILRVLVPCVGPSKAHDVSGAADELSGEKKPDTAPSAAGSKEKEAASQADASAEPHPSSLDAAADKLEKDPQLVIVPPSPLSDDPAVVVPPTPKKTVSDDDPEKVLASGVQRPGATQEEVTHDRRTTAYEGTETDRSSMTDDEEGEESHHMDEVEDDEERLIREGGAGIPIGPDGVPRPLLPPVAPHHAGRKCLVLDLDETLVHSSFKSISQADYVVPVEIEYHLHNVYVIKRPGVDNFLKKMGEIYEIVVFTASLSKYADPVLDKLDIHRVVTHRLFRESCYNHRGNYVKDLSQLGRPIADTIILDNSPASYIFHPNNAVPVSSWFNDPHDTELTDLCPFLTDLATVDDVRGILDGGI